MSMISSTKQAFLLLSIFISAYSYSQSLPGSAYNVFGIGSLEQTGLVSYEGMGYAGIGSRSTESVNIKNPAALTSVAYHNQIFDAGFSYSTLNQQTSNTSFNGASGSIQGLNYWFRLNQKAAASVGLSKYSDATFDITDAQAVDAIINSDSRHFGDGGSSQFHISSGYTPFKNLSIGAKANFIFGSVNHTETTYIEDLTANINSERITSFANATLEFGLQYEWLLKDNASITFGGTYRHGTNTALNEEVNIISEGFSSDTLTSSGNGTLYFPRKSGIGLGLKLKSWQLSVDYEYENWGENGEEEDFSYRDRHMFAFGGEYRKDRLSDNYLDRVYYRFGAGFQSNYIEVNGYQGMLQYYSLGLGFPMRNGSMINLSYQYIRSGTTDRNLILQQTNKLTLGVSFKDIWFIRSAYN